MVEVIETLIIGAGQAGLSLSYFLTQNKHPHLILEKATQLAEAWRNDRWDSFTLVTPNRLVRLPGLAYQGDDPDGFMPRDEVVSTLEQYAASFNSPVHLSVRVNTVVPGATGYTVETSEGTFTAKNVVVATGLFQSHRIPAYSANLPSSITQYNSGRYRNPEMLPSGAVLVAGSGQSGCQIAEELYQSGRKVYLSTGGSAGRVPRRYRGKDITGWLDLLGFFERTVDKLPSPKARFAGNPQASGKAGGHTINLHRFARDGVTLLGRITGAQENKLYFAPDLKDNLVKIDQFETNLVNMIDEYIIKNGLDAPTETLPVLKDGYAQETLTELDLSTAGINTIIWAIGYTFDFSWVQLPVLDSDGFPVTQRGITAFPGLYFLGMPWLHTQKSGLLGGVGEDAAHIASHILARTR
jgi:putative flavoprotein involved in K+ transport